MNRTTVFVLYHKAAPLFSSGVYRPLQTGAANAVERLGILSDDSGDNISDKNPNYGELSGWYWVWKNWLPAHPDTEMVGFCHYRRFLDPFSPPRGSAPFRPVDPAKFAARFSAWADADVERAFGTADIVLPAKLDLRKSPLYDRRHETVYTQYAKSHPREDMDGFLQLLCADSPQSARATHSFFNGHVLHDCLTFVMKRALFEDLAAWTFRLLFALEARMHWERYTGYMDIRTPAYILERAFNVWLALHAEATVAERDSFRIADSGDFPGRGLWLRLRRLRHPARDARTVPVPEMLAT